MKEIIKAALELLDLLLSLGILVTGMTYLIKGNDAKAIVWLVLYLVFDRVMARGGRKKQYEQD